MDCERIKNLLFPDHVDSARLLVDSAAFHDTGRNENISLMLSDLRVRIRDAIRESPKGQRSLYLSVMRLSVLAQGKGPLKPAMALHAAIKKCVGPKEADISALADYLMVMRSLREEDRESARGFHSSMLRESPVKAVRFLRALVACAMVTDCLREMRLDEAFAIFRDMDKERRLSRDGKGVLSVVGGSMLAAPAAVKRPQGAPSLTLVTTPGAPQALNLVGELQAIMGENDPEAMRLRIAKNLILFCAFHGDLARGEAIWEGLRKEPWFSGSPEEASFHRVMAYASGLSANGPKAFSHLAAYASSLYAGDPTTLRARVLLTLMFSSQKAGDKEGVLSHFDELWAMPDKGKPALPGIKARAATLLLKHYSQERDFPRVKEIFRTIGRMGCSSDVVSERFRASIEIIETYAGLGELSLALSLLQPLERLEGLEEYNFQRVRASIALVDALARQGKLREARELYFYQRQLTLPTACRDLADSLNFCYAAMDIERMVGEDLLRLEQGQKHSGFLLLKRANTAVALMDAFGRESDIKSVWSIYNSFDPPGNGGVAAFLRMGLVMSLFGAGDRKSFAQGDPNPLRFVRDSLLLSHLPQGRPEDGPALGSKAQSGAVPPKARTLSNAIRIAVRAGHTKMALGLYLSRGFQEATEEALFERASVAVTLGLGLIREGDYPALKRINQTGAYEHAEEGLKTGAALVSLHLITHHCDMGELESAREVFDKLPAAEGAGSPERVGIHTISSAIILNDAYIRAQHREGVGRMARFFASLSPLEVRLLKSYRLKLQERLDALGNGAGPRDGQGKVGLGRLVSADDTGRKLGS
ncbi:MAG: hypothetical protein LBF40_01025 [Deltaproteobacteria bacterium]|jgi:hypothetical protein|nr:hypothetical protein [Deltaproteobacteria bacterium]